MTIATTRTASAEAARLTFQPHKHLRTTTAVSTARQRSQQINKNNIQTTFKLPVITNDTD
jgi:hypothetical protein